MFENIINFFKNLGKKEEKNNNAQENSKSMAKERLHLVLMQDRANVSADFLELMKQEIIDVIKKYIEIDEKEIDVRLTNQENEDGTNGAPALYANIPIINIKNDARKISINNEKKDKNQEPTNIKNINKNDENSISKSDDKKENKLENNIRIENKVNNRINEDKQEDESRNSKKENKKNNIEHNKEAQKGKLSNAKDESIKEIQESKQENKKEIKDDKREIQDDKKENKTENNITNEKEKESGNNKK